MSVIAIVGSRDFNDYEVLKTEMNKFDIEKIVSGGAKGSDLLAPLRQNSCRLKF